MTASASGPASIAFVEFYSNGVVIKKDFTAPYSYTYSGLAAGSYVLTAVATDTMEETATSAAKTVTVTSAGNVAPTVTLTGPVNGATATAPGSFALSADASDIDGTVASVKFMSGTTLLNTDTTWPYAYTYSGVAAGSYTITAIATDNAGATTTSAAATVTVTNPPNTLPTVTLTAPYNGASTVAPGSFALAATAADSDGSITKVEFKSNGTVVATDTTAPYAYTYANLANGSYMITAVATDDRGGTATSATATVTVAPAAAVSLTRTYVYDAYHRLCKTINPESGATLIDYDAAGNISWTAEGTALTGNTCDRGSVTAGQKTIRTYDARNRLTAISTPGGTADVTTTYYADGLVNTLTAANPGGYNVSTTYSYNKRRLLTAETSSNGSTLYALGYGYDANGFLGAITYPDTQVVSYLPDALGRATKVGVTGGTTYASNITYHPNRAISGFTYGNGIVHTMTQNTRRLPARSRDVKSFITTLDDSYFFDENGNVDYITDATAANSNNRSRNLGYDGLDRLLVADAPNQWGTATYAYDALDNLTRADQGARQYRYNYDALTNRLLRITDPAGVSQIDLTYDAQGNVTGKNAQTLVFDSANRLSEVTGQQVYRYDGQGRRVQTADADGKTTFWIYSQSGQVLYTSEARRNRNLSYIYLGNTQVATRAVAFTTGAITVSYQHTDALGSIVAETNANGFVIKRNSYAPYGEAYAPTVIDGTGYTGHVMDQATGLTYMQQRYYDPGIGRFLSIDPAASEFNRYNYASNNPYRFKDPDGRQSVGELINSGAEGCGPVTCAGWATLSATWKVLGAEGFSQVLDKGGSAGSGDKLSAGLEVASAIPLVRGVRAAEPLVRGGVEAVRVGQAGEKAVKAAVDIGPKVGIKVNGVARIPDGLTPTTLSEVKNVASLSYTAQLRDFAQFAKDTGREFNLYVRPGAELSGPLRNAEAEGLVNILEIPFK